MVKNYIFLGAPGVGKGTLATQLVKKQGLVHLSTGDMFRQEIAQQTALGQKVQAFVASGDYVPDDLTNKIIKKVLLNNEVAHKGFILDGYPRTINQAQFLNDNHITIDYVVLLTAPMEVILNRLLGRKRQDDNPKIISQRIEVYNQKTKPLIDYYQNLQKLKIVDASGDLEDNWKKLLIALDKQ